MSGEREAPPPAAPPAAPISLREALANLRNNLGQMGLQSQAASRNFAAAKKFEEAALHKSLVMVCSASQALVDLVTALEYAVSQHANLIGQHHQAIEGILNAFKTPAAPAAPGDPPPAADGGASA